MAPKIKVAVLGTGSLGKEHARIYAELARFGGPHALKPGTALEKGDGLFMRADPAEPAPRGAAT